MNAGNSVKKYSYKEKVISRVDRFNRKHKMFKIFGLLYAIIAISVYNFLFYFYRNTKRFTCLACILLFFVASSSFSYPGMALTISFASDFERIDSETIETQPLSETTVEESDAQLAIIEDVDSEVIKEALESGNPDVAEAEHLDPEKQASLYDILNANATEDEDRVVETNEIEEEAVATAAEPEVEAIIESEPDFDEDDWKIMLVNKQHPIPDDYEFPLGTITGTMRCDERIITPLLDMMKAANSEGVSLIICSPYRDMNRQTMLFDNKIDKYMAAGMSYMEAYNLASQAVTVPGHSEHQVGLAIDIITDGYSNLDEGFGNTNAGKWLAANSYKYGFILRYPAGKEHITSIEFEPWHFRYVGVDAATFMVQNDICLEELWSTYVK
ncbi:MAG: M15 family metallopeptidase [Butyrivibrio sp.]|nr:M15 family metallopeptidase [Butyrivibrio sp.]